MFIYSTSYRTETDACSDADPDAYVSGSDSASVAFASAPGIGSLPATFPSQKDNMLTRRL